MSILRELTEAVGGGRHGLQEADLQHFKDLMNEAADVLVRKPNHYDWNLDSLASWAAVDASDREVQAEFIAILVPMAAGQDRKVQAFRDEDPHDYNHHLRGGWWELWSPRAFLGAMIHRLLRRKLPLSQEAIGGMLDWILEADPGYRLSYFYPLQSLVGIMESSPSEEHFPRLEMLREALEVNHPDASTRKLISRIAALSGSAPDLPLLPGEAWSDAAIGDLMTLGAEERASFTALLVHCKGASGSSPSSKWLAQTKKHLESIPAERLLEWLPRWFALVDKKRTDRAISARAWRERCALAQFDRFHDVLFQAIPVGKNRWQKISELRAAVSRAEDPWNYVRDFGNREEVREATDGSFPTLELPVEPAEYDAVEDQLIIPAHIDLLAGLCWACGTLDEPALARALGNLSVSAFRKVAGKGPRAIRLGNACITALSMMGSTEALGRLAFLKVKVKFGGAQNSIDKAFGRLAENLGVSREDLGEMSVPSYGMEEVGRLVLPLGEFTAVLSVVSTKATELSWLRADGKPQKSLPSSIKKECADEVKELMAAKKDIEKMLPAQAERLDGLYLQRKSWPFAVWRERYLDHPLVGALARRLIWKFTSQGGSTAAVWNQSGLVDRSGKPISLDESVTTVGLWHPLDEDAGVVLEWRDALERMGIVQPFKQAHREIYLLAPAEENTGVYSNRFAAHLLRQHQFNALCSARGWKNRLRLMVDDEYPPATRWLPAWGMRAEYWIEGAGTEYGADTLESGAYRYLTTDQVRFYREDAGQVTAHAGGGGYAGRLPADPLPLAEVDPLVFSEIMRDVDLFAGVASVGNDPNWLDGGTNQARRDYWHEQSFGELNASAKTRKTIIEKLVPRLKISAACRFEDHFLIVQGTRHRYKIHLGSGNILIDPPGRYLCIVPAQSQIDKAGDKLFLPFEGDRTLSVIISKAFLLAADDKITDPTILRQLA